MSYYVYSQNGMWHLCDANHPFAQPISDLTYQTLVNHGQLSGHPLSTPSPVKQKASTTNTPDVFIRKKTTKKVGFNIGSMMRSKSVNGDIGLEIEVEGNKFPKGGNHSAYGNVHAELIPAMWCYHNDGSLRGQDNAEYVLKKPIKFGEVKEAISSLWDMFAKFGSKLDESNRTSVHVHLNAQKWHLNRLTAFSALYFCVEELLTEWCGDHRVGNLFCLRAKDAPGIISKLKTFIQNNAEGGLPDGLHYGGFNVHALMKFGSIEIRALRGCTDPQTILDWVDILERLYKLSGEYKDPRAICENFSGEGPMAFLSIILGEKAQLVKEGIKWDNQRIMESMYEGIRLAQDLCYCREWSEYEPMEVQPDPFDRDIKKVAESIASQAEYLQAMTTPGAAGPVTGTYTLYTTQATIPATVTAWTDAELSAMLNSPGPVEEAPEQDTEAWVPDEWFDDDDYEDE